MGMKKKHLQRRHLVELFMKTSMQIAISAGALKPYVVLVEHGSTDQKRALVVKRLDQTDGVDGASAPPSWQKGDTGLVEAIPSTDGAAKPARKVITEPPAQRAPRPAATDRRAT